MQTKLNQKILLIGTSKQIKWNRFMLVCNRLEDLIIYYTYSLWKGKWKSAAILSVPCVLFHETCLDMIPFLPAEIKLSPELPHAPEGRHVLSKTDVRNRYTAFAERKHTFFCVISRHSLHKACTITIRFLFRFKDHEKCVFRLAANYEVSYMNKTLLPALNEFFWIDMEKRFWTVLAYLSHDASTIYHFLPERWAHQYECLPGERISSYAHHIWDISGPFRTTICNCDFWRYPTSRCKNQLWSSKPRFAFSQRWRGKRFFTWWH